MFNLFLLSKFDFGDRRSRYELVNQSTKEHHYHLVRSRCSEVSKLFGVSQNTIRRDLKELERMGLIKLIELFFLVEVLHQNREL